MTAQARPPWAALLVTCVVAVLGACAVAPANEPRPAPAARNTSDTRPQPPGRNTSDHLIDEGLRHLGEGRHDVARHHFAALLKLDPQDARGHFLLASLQHARAAGGERLAMDFAEVGYRQALEFDATFWPAAHGLGRLQLADRRYGEARQHLARAALLRPGEPRVLNDLAIASYYVGDVSSAASAIQEARRIKPAEPAFLRTEALVSAAAGDDAAARKAAAPIRASLGEPEWQRMERRLDDWADFHRREGAILLAQDSSAAAATAVVPLQPPKPAVANQVPRMVQVDVVMVRTEEVEGARRGVNLLDSLTLQFGGSRQSTATRLQDANGLTQTAQRVLTRTLTLPDLVYSLNIANDNLDHASVVARPSLVAADGQPATFFSGEEVTIALPGNFAGNIQDKNIGVSLAITPTFIGDDSVLLAVAASRSFANIGNPVLSGSFSQSLQTTKQAVNTAVALKFGETLILSGLSERQVERQSSSVPVLGDTPVLQYLFNQTDKLEYTKSVLILLTPRRVTPLSSTAQPARPTNSEDAASEDAMRELYAHFPRIFRAPANLDLMRIALARNRVLTPVRHHDLPTHPDPEAHQPRSFEKRLRDLLYY